MPSRSKIAHYWREKAYQYFDHLMDWGEPSCWACGTFIGSLDIDVSNSEEHEIFKVWENHNYLQRCHIIPKALGGCNCEANVILLCRRCHKSSPDTRDPVHFVNWVKNKKKVFGQEIQNVMTLLEYSPEEGDCELMLMEEFKEYYRGNAVVVAGSVPLSTYFACLIEFKEVYKAKYS